MCSTGHVRNGILFIGRCLAYRKTEETDLLRSKQGSCSSGGVWHTAKRDSTGYCSSTVDLLQPSPVTVHPRAPIHPSSTARSSTGYCSTSPLHGGPIKPPLHGLLFIQPSTGYCSTNPPPATVQPALHGVLFVQPSTGSCSSTPNRRGPVHPTATASTTMGSCSSNPHGELFIHPQQCSLFS